MARPKGLPKTGGKKKGSRNKVTLEKAKAIEASGLTPLDYMLSLLRDELNDTETRFEAAKAAAPYCHNKLASVEHHSKDGESGGVVIVWGGPRPKLHADS